MKQSIFTSALILLGTLSCWSQKYGYAFLPGWLGEHVVKTEYGYKTFGLNSISDVGYALEICRFDSSLRLISSKDDYFDTIHTVITTPFAYTTLRDSLMLVSMAQYDTINDWHGLLAGFTDEDSLIWQEPVYIGDRTELLKSIFLDTNYRFTL